MNRVITNGLEDRRSIPGRVIPKTQKMVLETVKGKVEQSSEWNRALPYTSV